MGSEWKTVRIEEVAEKVGIGPFGSSIKVETFVPFGIPIISGQHLKGSRLEDNTYNYISEAHADRLKNANVFRGDVIFTHAGNIGQVAYIPDESKYDRYILSQRQFYMRCNNEFVIPQFIVYFFKSHLGQHKLLSNASQVGVPSIAQPVSSLRRIEIPLPPLPEQHAIAHILGTLDDKIELNRRMNETLEAMARALFKSWFVDFDPVRAKVEGRDTRLPPEISDLFPDEFEDSELGEVPKGWQTVHLKDLSMLNPENWDRNNRPAEINYLDLSNTKWGHIIEVSVYRSEEAPSRAQRILRPGDTIVGTVRPGNGSYLLVSEQNLTGSTGFAVLRPQKTIYTELIYLAATSPSHIEELSHLADGGAYPAVRPEVVQNVQIACDLDHIVSPFSRCVKPLLAKIGHNEKENRTLSSLRDTLLPKLISGEIRVEEAEKYLEVVET